MKFAYFIERSACSAVRRSDQVFRVIFVGQFVERKGVSPLIEAVAEIHRRGVPAELLLVGAGSLAQQYRNEAAAYGIADRLVIEGSVKPEDIPMRLSSADVVVLPSLFDGWGLTVNEALYSGRPVVVTRNCGVEELVRYCSQWGVVVEHSSGWEIAEALEKIYRGYDQFVVDPDDVAAVIGCEVMTDHFLASVNWTRNREFARPEPKWSREEIGQQGIGLGGHANPA